ncbi:MAG: retropepsin-like aspartic protease [Leptolyngbyaceae cyanobacterium MO_188.B28]|nr:retropepsin-like aspartic protease [Leptolyngbyaceae cyanobacterium MO_188.B28]
MNQIPRPAVGRLAILSSSLVLLLSSCFNHNTANQPPSAPIASAQSEVASAPPKEPTPAPEAAEPQIDYYKRAINRASSAVAIGQSAQSQDDWRLAAGRWEQAITLLQQVPQNNPNYSLAQQKIREYQRNLAVTQQQADGTVIQATQATASSPDGLVANIPIVRRDGGIPVVSATLEGGQGSQRFTMLFDTGASGTLITPAMASAIGVVIVGDTIVEIADGSRVSMPVAYVDSIEVGGLVKEGLLVGIGGNTALLGQDFYGEYGVGISQNRISLYD